MAWTPKRRLNFVLDENISHKLADILPHVCPDCDVKHLTSLYGQGSPDAEWLGKLGRMTTKPVVIGGDGRILRNRAEQQALKSAGLTFVLLKNWTNIGWHEQAWKMVKVFPEIVREVGTLRSPTIYEITTAPKLSVFGLTANL